MSADGRVIGTYVHGLFADDRQRAAWLDALRRRRHVAIAYEALVETTLDSARRASRSASSISTGCSS